MMREAYAEAMRRKRLALVTDGPREVAARASLIGFTEYTYSQYKADPFHRLVGETLDQVVARKLRKVMIFAPPQHGKSELVSVRLPPYWLGNHPDIPVIISGYGADLVYSKSRQARQIVASEEYQRLYPTIRLADDSQAVNLWSLAQPNRGKLLAAGVGGPITGNGAGLAVIDDPIKNWQEAQSETIRETVWQWWRTVLRTRLWEGGSIVLLMTRWHEDDLAGRLLAEQGDEWHVLRLPAVAEPIEVRTANNKYMHLPDTPDPLGRQPGEPLAPHRFSAAELAGIESDVGSLVWGAMYQQVPRPADGNRFKRAWFTQLVDAAPFRVRRRVRYWDKAGTQGGDGAATAGVLISWGEDNLFYLEDSVQGWYSSAEREKVIKATAEADARRYGGPGAVEIWVEQEPGSGGKESAESTIANLAGYVIRADRPSGDKDTRLHPFAVQCEVGNVRVVRGAWNQNYIEEIIAIPNGKRRDQGDASAGAFNKLTLGRRIEQGTLPGSVADYRGG